MISARKIFISIGLIGTISCKPISQSSSEGAADFGGDNEKLQSISLIGDRQNAARNSWWIQNKAYKIALFKEFGGPKQVIDGLTEEQIAANAVAMARRGQEELNGNSRLRALHAKAQACLKGKMTVLPSIFSDGELRFGVFKPLADGSLPIYEVLGRFSNASGQSQSDTVSQSFYGRWISNG